MNIQKMMKQAQQMQRDMARVQGELEAKEYTVEKAGMLKVQVNGKFEVKSVEINEELINSEYKEELESALVLGFTEAMKKVNDDKEKSLGNLTQGMNIPGLF